MAEFAQPIPAPPRVVAAVIAVLASARDRSVYLTRLKVAKILYLGDLDAVKAGREPVSGVSWAWLQHGPYDYDLIHLENYLVERDVITRTSINQGRGYRLELAGDYTPRYELPEEDRALIDDAVARYGPMDAGTLKDLSYQTDPMLAAQELGRGVTLDLGLARPVPTFHRASAMMREVLAALPGQTDEPGAVEELQADLDELAPARRHATTTLLGDA